jgi:hypothetical protein
LLHEWCEHSCALVQPVGRGPDGADGVALCRRCSRLMGRARGGGHSPPGAEMGWAPYRRKLGGECAARPPTMARRDGGRGPGGLFRNMFGNAVPPGTTARAAGRARGTAADGAALPRGRSGMACRAWHARDDAHAHRVGAVKGLMHPAGAGQGGGCRGGQVERGDSVPSSPRRAACMALNPARGVD